jgi:signal peptidase I
MPSKLLHVGGWLTIPSSGPACGGPLKSNVRPHELSHSMLAKIYRHFVQPRLAFASAKARARKAGFVAFKVLAGNMEPTLTAGDIGCIKAFVYPNGAIARGQVIAYRSEKHHGVIVPSRVVALAGESVEIRNGELFVEDVHVPEPYISNGRAEQDYSRTLQDQPFRKRPSMCLGISAT